ncbi:MAG: TRAP transporter large permease subunit [Spirochaetes bacterium]|nr:TRAP transporter large permease subunit [Spirochaetota bacterium]
MEMGSWGIIPLITGVTTLPALGEIGPVFMLALIPMIAFIVLSFNENIDPVLNSVAAVVIGVILLGLNPMQIGSMFASALGSTLGLIGFIMAFGAGVGIQMSKTGVSQTLCQWVVDGIGVNSQKKGMLVVMICAVVICALTGTMAGGLAIIAPIVIPIVAAVGLRPSVVGALFQSSGETGLIWGPFSPPVVALVSIAGISYAQQMIWGAIPYGIVWLVVIFFVGLYLQKKNSDVYELTEDEKKKIEITPKMKRTAIAFLVTFALLVVYAIAAGTGVSYVVFVMFVLSVVMSVFGGVGPAESTKNILTGIKNSAGFWLLFVMLECFMNVVDFGGGFAALGNIFLGLMGDDPGQGGQSLVMILGTLVGSFGISGGAVAQIAITHDLFAPALYTVGLPMEFWAIVLICGSRVTSSIYPGVNMIAPMGIARSSDLKAMLIGGWAVSMVSIVLIIIWAFVGPAFFGALATTPLPM